MKRIQCRCGRVIGLPRGTKHTKFRCPACNSIFRIRLMGTSRSHADRAAVDVASDSATDDAVDYQVVDAEPGGSVPGPARGHDTSTDRSAAESPPRAAAVEPASTFVVRDAVVTADEVEDDCGPFLDQTALLYPWLSPTWGRWLALAFMTELAVAATATALFFLFVAVSFNAFGSLFTFAAMVTVCLGLWSYVSAVFVMVLEDSANGDDRLDKLPGYVWYEILPPFLRTAGAALCAFGIALGTTHVLRDFVGPWYTPARLVINNVMAFVLFPVFMISNSVDQSFFPIYSLVSTCTRIVRRFDYFVLFLILSGVLWTLVDVLLWVLSFVHIGLGIAAAGPVLAMWFLYYGHWIGRLARQLSFAE